MQHQASGRFIVNASIQICHEHAVFHHDFETITVLLAWRWMHTQRRLSQVPRFKTYLSLFLGLIRFSESNHGALDNLTAQPHPANNPYSQPLAYLPFGPSLSGSSTPSRIHPSHLSTAPFPHGNTATAFSSNSYFPNDALSQLYGLVKESPFILNNQPEPVLSSEEGQTLVRAVLHVPDCPEVAWQKSDRSIFTLFVDCKAYKCLICGHKKTSLERAVGCVRSHLRHRPFACPGEAFGCTSCKKRAK
ncbi:hypothetical protein M408DRAFT_282907 [Serendipita vermifera MAFF 305830]|uniref:Uncharacterized protein n=1 Tax=Serendipita vermifera MAFF 305830 TaxID=933852 RepID=A0A0C2WZC1_SERVB|nr:hypothetical protein M408DRAFT_282907 [Serendipita vermifera MAFF 305830]